MKLSDEQKSIITEYGHLFNNTGDNDIVELIEREGVTYFNNGPVAELQGCCLSQVMLIQQLKHEGLLPESMSIWVAVVEHRHGQNVYVARTEYGVLDQLYDYVQEWWDSEIPDEEMPTDLPKKEVIDQYFSKVGPERLETLSETTLIETRKDGENNDSSR